MSERDNVAHGAYRLSTNGRYALATVLIVLAGGGLISPAVASPGTSPDSLRARAVTVSRLIVSYEPGTSIVEAPNEATGSSLVGVVELAPGQNIGAGMRTVLLSEPVSEIAAQIIADELETHPAVRWAEPDVRIVPLDAEVGRVNAFSYLSSPKISELSVTEGPLTGGTAVTITGANLAAVNRVIFGSSVATIVSRTATTVTVLTPKNMLATVAVTVVNPSGSARKAAAFRYVPAPTITAITPAHGPKEGGTRVVLDGTNFSTVNSVTFGSVAATIISRTTTTLVVSSPAVSKPGVVTVTASSPSGTVTTRSAFSYQWTPLEATYTNGTLWGLNGANGISVAPLWQQTVGTRRVVVAVIDTGGTSHPDAGPTVPGYDMVSLDDTDANDIGDSAYTANDGDGPDPNPADPGDWISAAENAGTADGGFFTGCGQRSSSWHATHVSGTINAAANTIGTVGVASAVAVQHVRALGKCGGYLSDIVAAIVWAAGGAVAGIPKNTAGVAVINMSLGGASVCEAESALQQAIDFAVNRNITVVVAAGNENADASGSEPASCHHVITVAATGPTGRRALFSNYGSTVDISAPGIDIYSTINNGATSPTTAGYRSYSGTSMAAPHVAGVVALLYSLKPTLTPAMIENILVSTATPFAGGACDTASPLRKTCGGGIVNAIAAARLVRR